MHNLQTQDDMTELVSESAARCDIRKLIMLHSLQSRSVCSQQLRSLSINLHTISLINLLFVLDIKYKEVIEKTVINFPQTKVTYNIIIIIYNIFCILLCTAKQKQENFVYCTLNKEHCVQWMDKNTKCFAVQSSSCCNCNLINQLVVLQIRKWRALNCFKLTRKQNE